MNTMTRAIAIHDLSGYGRCSLGVVIPVLTAMDIQCCSLPTAFFSTHTGFDGFLFHDLTERMLPAARHWATLGLTFNAIYSGFLGSAAQIDIVLDIIKLFRRPGMLTVVDPVMGDHGVPYRTYTPDMCRQMTKLAQAADIITPNLTEAAILLERRYEDAPKDEDGAFSWLSDLSLGGTRTVVMTGLILREGMVSCVYFDALTKDRGIFHHPFAGQEYHGTGDLYTSVLTGRLLLGDTLPDAVRTAAVFVHDCAELSWSEHIKPSEGVHFESMLHKLGNKI